MSRTERWLTRSVRPEPLRKSASQQADGRRGRALLAHPAHRASAPERTCHVLRNPDIFTCSRQPSHKRGMTGGGTKRTLSEGLLYARKLPLIARRGPMLLRNELPPRAALLKAASSRLSKTKAASAVSRLGWHRASLCRAYARSRRGKGCE